MATKKEWVDRIRKAKTRDEVSRIEKDAERGHGLSDKDAHEVHAVLVEKVISLKVDGVADAKPKG